MMRDTTAQNILDRLSDRENYPEETLIPYRKFSVDNETYYFTPGGFLYRKDSGVEEVGGFFCGYSPTRPGTTERTMGSRRLSPSIGGSLYSPSVLEGSDWEIREQRGGPGCLVGLLES